MVFRDQVFSYGPTHDRALWLGVGRFYGMHQKAILRRLRHAQAMEGVYGQGWLAIRSRDITAAAWRDQAEGWRAYC
jgi:hypothetical protein